MLENILKSFQLQQKETEIVTKMTELGPQPASSIARMCDMPRNTVRHILDVLAKRGLVAKTMRANTQYYSLETKEHLISALKLQKMKIQQELDDQITLLEEYGHELTDRSWAASRPRIRYYEGWSGLEKVYEDTLNAKALKSWASFEEMYETMPDYFRTYFSRRAEKGIPIRSIHPDVPKAREAQKRDKKELRESALVPSDRFQWGPEVQIYNDKINISSWKEKLGIIIESREIAQAMETFFDLSYEAAKQYGKVTELPEKHATALEHNTIQKM